MSVTVGSLVTITIPHVSEIACWHFVYYGVSDIAVVTLAGALVYFPP